MKVQFGYACISNLHPNLKCSQNSTKSYLEKIGETRAREYLMEKARSNLNNLQLLLQKNVENKIYAFRLPEQLLPQADLGYYSWEEFKPQLKAIGKYCNRYNIKLSQHPSQYFVLNSTRQEVVDKTIKSLNMFADILAAFELKHIPNLTIHVGAKASYRNLQEACDAFCRNYHFLNDNAKRFLVVENDQNSFSTEHCMYIHEQIGIPVVFDNAHFKMNQANLTFDEAVKLSLSTWNNRIPKFHLSSEDEQTRHAHADYIDKNDFKELIRSCLLANCDKVIFILECKEKDKALLQLMGK